MKGLRYHLALGQACQALRPCQCSTWTPPSKRQVQMEFAQVDCQVAWIADKTRCYTRFGSAIAVGANASSCPGGTFFSAAKTANLPKIHLGCRMDSIHQVDIDIGSPFATRWAQVNPGGFSRALTWWSPTSQKKLSNYLKVRTISGTPN